MADRQWLSAVTARLPLDRHAARRATLLAACAVVVLFGLQMAVTAAVTGSDQPMGSVEVVPVQPQAATWEDAPSRTVQLNKQQMAIPYGGGSTDELQVQALTNDSHVSVRLSWDDPTPDEDLSAPGNYSDAAAVMFANGEMPPITMGAVGQPVNIWYWRASWEANTSAYGTGDMYSYNYAKAGTNAQPANAVDNPLSKARYETHAQNYYAEGFGSTSYAPTQPVEAEGTRTDEGWAVTFVRERSTDGEFDVAFGSDRTVYMAFAVWNGSADEVNGQKSITLQYSKLDPATGNLSAASPPSSDGGAGGGDGGAGDGATGGDGGASGGGLGLGGFMYVLVVSVLFVWFVAYWRLYE